MLEEVLEVVGESFWEELHLVEEILLEDLVDSFEEVVEILVENGTPVEYNQVLMLVRPS